VVVDDFAVRLLVLLRHVRLFLTQRSLPRLLSRDAHFACTPLLRSDRGGVAGIAGRPRAPLRFRSSRGCSHGRGRPAGNDERGGVDEDPRLRMEAGLIADLRSADERRIVIRRRSRGNRRCQLGVRRLRFRSRADADHENRRDRNDYASDTPHRLVPPD